MHVDEWDRYAYAREAYRILKPGGRFVADNLNLLSDEGWQVFLAHCEVRPEKRPPHFSRFSTPQELETYFSRAGFLEIRQKPYGSVIVTVGIK
jgi:SAM-dependent methyltransferase